MRNALPTGLLDEYQDGISAGSLVKARRCWIDLSVAGAIGCRQQFTFVFRSPSERAARNLRDFLRRSECARVVRTAHRNSGAQIDGWAVVGSTRAVVWSLASLEHLFMRARGAAARYGSVLVELDLVPPAPCP